MEFVTSLAERIQVVITTFDWYNYQTEQHCRKRHILASHLGHINEGYLPKKIGDDRIKNPIHAYEAGIQTLTWGFPTELF